MKTNKRKALIEVTLGDSDSKFGFCSYCDTEGEIYLIKAGLSLCAYHNILHEPKYCIFKVCLLCSNNFEKIYKQKEKQRRQAEIKELHKVKLKNKLYGIYPIIFWQNKIEREEREASKEASKKRIEKTVETLKKELKDINE